LALHVDRILRTRYDQWMKKCPSFLAALKKNPCIMIKTPCGVCLQSIQHDDVRSMYDIIQ